MDRKPSFAIKVATPDDDNVVSDILLASYATLFPLRYDDDVLATALPLMTKAHAGLLQSGRYFVAKTSAGQSVGCGGWSFEDPGTKKLIDGLGHIRHFATHPRWTGLGVGKTILSRCLDEAVAAGLRQILCFAALGSEQFYAASGFTKIEDISIALPNQVFFPATKMRWESNV